MGSLRWQVKAPALLLFLAIVTAACSGDGADPASNPVLTGLHESITIDGEPVSLTGEELLPGAAVVADEDGLGMARFSDGSELEVALSGRFVAPDLRERVAGPISMTLEGGHILFQVGEAERVVITFGSASFTTDVPGTVFALCYNPDKGAWCLSMNRGEGQWQTAKGSTPIRAPESVFAPDMETLPEGVRCAPPGAFAAWQDAIRDRGDVLPLPALVNTWPVGPCGPDSTANSEALNRDVSHIHLDHISQRTGSG